MSENTLIPKLKRVADKLKAEGRPENVIVNALKEELQYYVLDFVYNHSNYSKLTMYGGTLLRIGYGLTRLSEDLDFQTTHPIDLEKLKEELIRHFASKYNFDMEVSINPRDDSDTKLLKLSFDILAEFNLATITWTKLKLRFDINYFDKTDEFIKENLQIVHDGLAFSIKTYALSTLMASKIAAVLLRSNRGIRGLVSDCKPRDIYDLIWYLQRNTFPDIEYLRAKGLHFETMIELFDILKLKIPNLKDSLFEEDLAQFFFDRSDFDSWFSNWRQKFITLMDAYKIYRVKDLMRISFKIDFSTENRTIQYLFSTDNVNEYIYFAINISDYWFEWNDLKIPSGHRINEIEPKVETASGSIFEIDYEYIGLFYSKIKDFITRNNGVLFRNHLTTKLIRATADKLDPERQVYLNRRLLEKVQLEELT